MYDHRQHQVCGDDGEDDRIFLSSRAENSQHCSRVITEQRSFAVWRLAIAFARRRSLVVSSECDDLHFDSAGNDSATISSYPTRRDYCKLLALLRTEKFSIFAVRLDLGGFRDYCKLLALLRTGKNLTCAVRFSRL